MTAWKDSIRQAAVYLLPWAAVGLLLRAWRVSLALVMCRDETTYAYQILHVLDGTMFQDTTFYTFPPAYAVISAPFAYVLGDAELAGRVVSCLAGAATVVPVFYLAKDLFGLRSATVAAGVAAVLPSLMNVGVMSEPTYTFLLVSGVFLANRAYMTKSRAMFALFGLSLAGAYLCRPEAFFIFFALGAVLLLMLIRTGTARRTTIALACFALAGFFVLSLPYLVQLRLHFGAWELSGKTRINLAKVKAMETLKPGENFDAADTRIYNELESNRKHLAGNVIAEMGAIASRYPDNMRIQIVELKNAAGYPILAMFVIGAGFALKRPRPFEALGLLFAALVPLLLIPMVFILQRIIVPYIPAMIVLASFGAVRLAELVAARAEAWAGGSLKKAAPPLATTLFGGALLIGNMGGVIPETDFQKRLDSYASCSYYYALKQVAGQIRPFLVPGTKVMTRNNIFAYYAGCEYVPIPAESVEGILKTAQDNEARYLFCGPMEMELRPGLASAIMKSGGPAQDPIGDGSLRLVYSKDVFMLYKVYGRRAEN